MACGDKEETAEIGHVAVKLPQFWTSDPDAWFLQSEAESRIPGDTSYATLKARLIKDFTRPTWDAMWNIIQHPDLSDQSPSTLLATLLGMIPTGEKPDKWFQALYLLKLPSELRGPLSALKWEDVRQMGEHADILWGAHRRNNTSSTHHKDVPIQASREARSPSRNKKPTRHAAMPGQLQLQLPHYNLAIDVVNNCFLESPRPTAERPPHAGAVQVKFRGEQLSKRVQARELDL